MEAPTYFKASNILELTEEAIKALYLKEKEVSKITRRGLQTLRNDRHHGKGIPYIKNGRSILYRLDDILNYLNSRRISTLDSD